MLPATTLAGIRDAVLSIYRGEGLPSSQDTLTVACAMPAPADKKAEPETRTTTLLLEGSNNPQQNIQGFVLQRDGLTRVHPRAFLAILEVALKTSISQLSITSNWRPMMGSKAHRLGLGLDVGAIWADSKTEILLKEREALSDPSKSSTLVSAKERETYNAYLAARSTAKTAGEQVKKDSAAVDAAAVEVNRIRVALNTAKKVKKGATPDAALLERLAQELSQAEKILSETSEKQPKSVAARDAAMAGESTAKTSWRVDLEADDPSVMRRFREAVMAHPFVGQLFDPWYIDFNARDKVAPDLNDQCDGLKKAHNNHLHITVADPVLMRL